MCTAVHTHTQRIQLCWDACQTEHWAVDSAQQIHHKNYPSSFRTQTCLYGGKNIIIPYVSSLRPETGGEWAVYVFICLFVCVSWEWGRNDERELVSSAGLRVTGWMRASQRRGHLITRDGLIASLSAAPWQPYWAARSGVHRLDTHHRLMGNICSKSNCNWSWRFNSVISEKERRCHTTYESMFCKMNELLKSEQRRPQDSGPKLSVLTM